MDNCYEVGHNTRPLFEEGLCVRKNLRTHMLSHLFIPLPYSQPHLIIMRKLCASWKLHFDVVVDGIVEFCWYFNGFCIESIFGSGVCLRNSFRPQSVVTLNLPSEWVELRLVNGNRRWSPWSLLCARVILSEYLHMKGWHKTEFLDTSCLKASTSTVKKMFLK